MEEGTVKGPDLEFSWHNELWSFHPHEHVDSAEDEDGQDDGKVTDEFPHLGSRETLLLRPSGTSLRNTSVNW